MTMKSDSASILLNLTIERSVNGLSVDDQMLMDELIAAAIDPARVASDLRQSEVVLTARDFTNFSEGTPERGRSKRSGRSVATLRQD